MSQPEIRSAIVLVIDRLGANMLGAYGSTWFETQNFNRLAARSLVFDQAITGTPQLQDFYQQCWRSGVESGLIETLNQQSIETVLLTDEKALTESNVAKSFDRIIPVEQASRTQVTASIGETELASFFAQASQAVSDLESGSCLWLHSRGLSGVWDAPMALRNKLADADDPDPPDFTQPPACFFDADTDDPDELLGYQQVSAAQVTMIDDFLGVILDLLENEIHQSTLFCLVSPRGYPLGEHGLVGHSEAMDFQACHGESIQVPMMVCLPPERGAEFTRSIRVGNLVQPDWITDGLQQWFGDHDQWKHTIESTCQTFPRKRKEVAYSVLGDSESIQTHAWKMIRGLKSGKPAIELFAKPDDRCEVNDVSRRCRSVVEQLSAILDQHVEGGRLVLPPEFVLPEELGIRVD